MKYTIALVARVAKMPAAAAIMTFPVRLASKEIVTASFGPKFCACNIVIIASNAMPAPTEMIFLQALADNLISKPTGSFTVNQRNLFDSQ